MNIELEKIRVQRKAIKDSLEALNVRERQIEKHEREANSINADDPLIKSDVRPEQVNYIMGQSAGYVAGFRSAIDTVINTLSSAYKYIPMTEDELYMLVELGEMKERAWLKDNKQRKILEKNGWKQNCKDFSSPLVWEKEEPEPEPDPEDEVSE